MARTRPEDFNVILQGRKALQMVHMVQRQLGVKRDDFTLFGKQEVIDALNLGALKFVSMTGCLRIPIILRPTASQQNYRMPLSVLRVVAAKFYTSESANDYYELKILRDSRLMQRIDSEYRGALGTPNYAFPVFGGDRFWNLGFSPIPASSGEAFDETDYDLVASTFNLGTMASIAGTHKTGYSASAFLVDNAGRNLASLGALQGYPIFNTTKGAAALVRALGDEDATNDKVTATLSNNATWDTGDAFVIPLADYGISIDSVAGTVEILSSASGELSNVLPGTDNFLLEGVRQPLPLSPWLDNQVCEIPINYQDAVIAYAVAELGGSGDAKAIFDNYVLEYETRGNKVEVSDNMIEDRSREWLV